jgi:hypothetical protein
MKSSPSPIRATTYKHYRIIWHYARGMAFVRKQRLESANRELTALQKLGEDPELATLMATMTNPSSSILQVARAVYCRVKLPRPKAITMAPSGS